MSDDKKTRLDTYRSQLNNVVHARTVYENSLLYLPTDLVLSELATLLGRVRTSVPLGSPEDVKFGEAIDILGAP